MFKENSILDNDTIFVFGLVFLSSLEYVSPWITLAASIVAILLAIYKIVESRNKIKESRLQQEKTRLEIQQLQQKEKDYDRSHPSANPDIAKAPEQEPPGKPNV